MPIPTDYWNRLTSFVGYGQPVGPNTQKQSNNPTVADHKHPVDQTVTSVKENHINRSNKPLDYMRGKVGEKNISYLVQATSPHFERLRQLLNMPKREEKEEGKGKRDEGALQQDTFSSNSEQDGERREGAKREQKTTNAPTTVPAATSKTQPTPILLNIPDTSPQAGNQRNSVARPTTLSASEFIKQLPLLHIDVDLSKNAMAEDAYFTALMGSAPNPGSLLDEWMMSEIFSPQYLSERKAGQLAASLESLPEKLGFNNTFALVLYGYKLTTTLLDESQDASQRNNLKRAESLFATKLCELSYDPRYKNINLPTLQFKTQQVTPTFISELKEKQLQAQRWASYTKTALITLGAVGTALSIGGLIHHFNKPEPKIPERWPIPYDRLPTFVQEGIQGISSTTLVIGSVVSVVSSIGLGIMGIKYHRDRSSNNIRNAAVSTLAIDNQAPSRPSSLPPSTGASSPSSIPTTQPLPTPNLVNPQPHVGTPNPAPGTVPLPNNTTQAATSALPSGDQAVPSPHPKPTPPPVPSLDGRPALSHLTQPAQPQTPTVSTNPQSPAVNPDPGSGTVPQPSSSLSKEDGNQSSSPSTNAKPSDKTEAIEEKKDVIPPHSPATGHEPPPSIPTPPTSPFVIPTDPPPASPSLGSPPLPSSGPSVDIRGNGPTIEGLPNFSVAGGPSEQDVERSSGPFLPSSVLSNMRVQTPPTQESSTQAPAAQGDVQDSEQPTVGLLDVIKPEEIKQRQSPENLESIRQHHLAEVNSLLEQVKAVNGHVSKTCKSFKGIEILPQLFGLKRLLEDKDSIKDEEAFLTIFDLFSKGAIPVNEESEEDEPVTDEDEPVNASTASTPTTITPVPTSTSHTLNPTSSATGQEPSSSTTPPAAPLPPPPSLQPTNGHANKLKEFTADAKKLVEHIKNFTKSSTKVDFNLIQTQAKKVADVFQEPQLNGKSKRYICSSTKEFKNEILPKIGLTWRGPESLLIKEFEEGLQFLSGDAKNNLKTDLEKFLAGPKSLEGFIKSTKDLVEKIQLAIKAKESVNFKEIIENAKDVLNEIINAEITISEYKAQDLHTIFTKDLGLNWNGENSKLLAELKHQLQRLGKSQFDESEDQLTLLESVKKGPDLIVQQYEEVNNNIVEEVKELKGLFETKNNINKIIHKARTLLPMLQACDADDKLLDFELRNAGALIWKEVDYSVMKQELSSLLIELVKPRFNSLLRQLPLPASLLETYPDAANRLLSAYIYPEQNANLPEGLKAHLQTMQNAVIEIKPADIDNLKFNEWKERIENGSGITTHVDKFLKIVEEISRLGGPDPRIQGPDLTKLYELDEQGQQEKLKEFKEFKENFKKLEKELNEVFNKVVYFTKNAKLLLIYKDYFQSENIKFGGDIHAKKEKLINWVTNLREKIIDNRSTLNAKVKDILGEDGGVYRQNLIEACQNFDKGSITIPEGTSLRKQPRALKENPNQKNPVKKIGGSSKEAANPKIEEGDLANAAAAKRQKMSIDAAIKGFDGILTSINTTQGIFKGKKSMPDLIPSTSAAPAESQPKQLVALKPSGHNSLVDRETNGLPSNGTPAQPKQPPASLVTGNLNGKNQEKLKQRSDAQLGNQANTSTDGAILPTPKLPSGYTPSSLPTNKHSLSQKIATPTGIEENPEEENNPSETPGISGSSASTTTTKTKIARIQPTPSPLPETPAASTPRPERLEDASLLIQNVNKLMDQEQLNLKAIFTTLKKLAHHLDPELLPPSTRPLTTTTIKSKIQLCACVVDLIKKTSNCTQSKSSKFKLRIQENDYVVRMTFPRDPNVEEEENFKARLHEFYNNALEFEDIYYASRRYEDKDLKHFNELIREMEEFKKEYETTLIKLIIKNPSNGKKTSQNSCSSSSTADTNGKNNLLIEKNSNGSHNASPTNGNTPPISSSSTPKADTKEKNNSLLKKNSNGSYKDSSTNGITHSISSGSSASTPGTGNQLSIPTIPAPSHLSNGNEKITISPTTPSSAQHEPVQTKHQKRLRKLSEEVENDEEINYTESKDIDTRILTPLANFALDRLRKAPLDTELEEKVAKITRSVHNEQIGDIQNKVFAKYDHQQLDLNKINDFCTASKPAMTAYNELYENNVSLDGSIISDANYAWLNKIKKGQTSSGETAQGKAKTKNLGILKEGIKQSIKLLPGLYTESILYLKANQDQKQNKNEETERQNNLYRIFTSLEDAITLIFQYATNSELKTRKQEEKPVEKTKEDWQVKLEAFRTVDTPEAFSDLFDELFGPVFRLLQMLADPKGKGPSTFRDSNWAETNEDYQLLSKRESFVVSHAMEILGNNQTVFHGLNQKNGVKALLQKLEEIYAGAVKSFVRLHTKKSFKSDNTIELDARFVLDEFTSLKNTILSKLQTTDNKQPDPTPQQPQIPLVGNNSHQELTPPSSNAQIINGNGEDLVSKAKKFQAEKDANLPPSDIIDKPVDLSGSWLQ